MEASLVPTPHFFRFPFCQRLTKHQDDIVVAKIVADMVAEMEVNMVIDIDVVIVANLEVGVCDVHRLDKITASEPNKCYLSIYMMP